jgi:hypothetical protein
MEKNKGGRPTGKTGTHAEPFSESSSLEEIGVSKKLSSEAQALASLLWWCGEFFKGDDLFGTKGGLQ